MRIVFGTDPNPTWIQKMILWTTDSKWTHCFLKTEQSFNGSNITIEASPEGGVRLSLDAWENSDREEYQCLFDFEDVSFIDAYLTSYYGYMHAFGFLVQKIFRLKHNPIPGNLVCSGVVDAWIRTSPAAAVFALLSLNDSQPQNLYEIVIAHPELFRKV